VTTKVDWRPVRWTALACYVVVLVFWSDKYGVPIGHDIIFAWIFVGLTCASIGKSWKSILHMLIDWGPFLVVLIAYDLSRGWADNLGMTVHFTPQIDADKLLFGGVPTEWLQAHLYHRAFASGGLGSSLRVFSVQPVGPVQWYEVVFDLTYISHYLASFVLAALLWVKERARFQAFARRFTTLSFFGFVTYALFPAAPPWMAARDGYIDRSVGRMGGRGFAWLHLHPIGNLIDVGARSANLVAAVPSLHAGFATLVAITLWKRASKWVRPFIAAYPVLMGLMLVATGEHYVIDILLGAAYAFAVHAMWSRIEPWWARRKHGPDVIESADARSLVDSVR
jgi:hypothetical protein